MGIVNPMLGSNINGHPQVFKAVSPDLEPQIWIWPLALAVSSLNTFTSKPEISQKISVVLPLIEVKCNRFGVSDSHTWSVDGDTLWVASGA